MESYIIWIITLGVILGIFIPYFLSFKKKQKQDLERKREAESIGIGKPRSQFPMIDNAACIGCGSCVEACPEGDVLGVVFGKATIINGERCVGHGYCELVCPVGALKVGLGDIKTREDIPLMDRYNETTVKGLFIAGELGGISLIRNAISQGRTVVERIAALTGETGAASNSNFDIIIVGGGPAGLSAALSAIDKELSYIVLDQQEPGGTILQYPRKKLVMTEPVDIPLYGTLDKSEYSKEHLLKTWQEITKKYNLNINVEGQVQKVEKTTEGFVVTTAGRSFTSSYVVLAMGRRGTPRKLCVPGEDQPKVLYQLVDAQSYNNNDILVVGGGDSAVEAAVGLARQENNRVTISYRKPKFFRMKKKNEDRINEMIKSKKIRPLFNSGVVEVREKSILIKVDNEISEIPNDFVFVFAGGIPPFDMLKAMGIKFGGEFKQLSETCAA